MAKIYPDLQQFLDLRDGTQVGITKITILTTGSDHVELPPITDLAFLQADTATADPAFYLSGNNKTQVNIDSSTAGTKMTVVTSHVMINFGSDDVG